MSTARTWLWQGCYAVLGLGFFIGAFLAFASYGTRPFGLWVTVSLGSIATLAVLARYLAPRRTRADACPHCGYARAGLTPGAKCPECGR